MSCCMNKNKEKNKVHIMNEVFEPRGKPTVKNVPVKRRESIYPMKPSKKEEITPFFIANASALPMTIQFVIIMQTDNIKWNETRTAASPSRDASAERCITI